MNFGATDRKLGSASTIWYPATGIRFSFPDLFYYVGLEGRCWSSSTNSNNALNFWFVDYGKIMPVSNSNRVSGISVRCQKIQ